MTDTPDIVEQLLSRRCVGCEDLCLKAADEITRLHVELAEADVRVAAWQRLANTMGRHHD